MLGSLSVHTDYPQRQCPLLEGVCQGCSHVQVQVEHSQVSDVLPELPPKLVMSAQQSNSLQQKIYVNPARSLGLKTGVTKYVTVKFA